MVFFLMQSVHIAVSISQKMFRQSLDYMQEIFFGRLLGLTLWMAIGRALMISNSCHQERPIILLQSPPNSTRQAISLGFGMDMIPPISLSQPMQVTLKIATCQFYNYLTLSGIKRWKNDFPVYRKL